MELFKETRGVYFMAPALWGTIATLLWIFSTKATSVWDLWWVPFSL